MGMDTGIMLLVMRVCRKSQSVIIDMSVPDGEMEIDRFEWGFRSDPDSIELEIYITQNVFE